MKKRAWKNTESIYTHHIQNIKRLENKREIVKNVFSLMHAPTYTQLSLKKGTGKSQIISNQFQVQGQEATISYLKYSEQKKENNYQLKRQLNSRIQQQERAL